MPRMLTRWGLIALAWFALVPVVQAQFVVFTVQSVDAVLDQVRHTMKLAGKEEEAKQLDGMLQAYLSDDGLKGLDTKRPLGLYLARFETIDEKKPPVVAFVPVTNEKDFVALLTKLNVPLSEADKDGLRHIELGIVSIHVRFAHGHAFAAVDETQLKGELPDPAKLLTDSHRNHLLALTANLEQMPAQLKTKLLEGLAKEMDKQAKGATTKAQQQNLKAQKYVHDALQQVLQETREISLTAHHDRQARKVRVDFSVTPRPGTNMAQQVKNFGGSRSQFAALAEDAAMNIFLNFPIDGEIRAALDKAIEEGFQEALKEEKSLAKKAVAEKAFAVLAPTLKSDVFDLFLTVRGPQSDGKFTLLGGLRVKNGQEIEQLLKSFLNDLPEKDRANVQVDVAKVDGLSIHRVKFPEGDKDAKRLFGSSEAFFLFHKDYALLTVGTYGLEELKKAVSRINTPGQKQFAPLHMTFALRQLMHFEENDAKRSKAVAAAKTAFTGDGQDVIQITWAGDTTLRLRFEMSDQIIKFLALLGDEGGE